MEIVTYSNLTPGTKTEVNQTNKSVKRPVFSWHPTNADMGDSFFNVQELSLTATGLQFDTGETPIRR